MRHTSNVCILHASAIFSAPKPKKLNQHELFMRKKNSNCWLKAYEHMQGWLWMSGNGAVNVYAIPR